MIARRFSVVINPVSRFVFVHVPKAAGTSVSEALRALPGNDDRPVHPTTKHETIAQWLTRDGGGRGFADGIGDYLVFGFVRNPWDRIASLYRYLREARPRMEIDTVASFEDFLRQARDGVGWIRGLHSFRPQSDFFDGAPSGRLFVGHFEHLADDVEAVSRALGTTISLPRVNASSHAGRDYRDAYTSDLAEVIATQFAGDVSRFGYRFETTAPAERADRSALARRLFGGSAGPAA